MSLVQVLISNYQTVGDGRFGETVFGLYTPPDVGPVHTIVRNTSMSWPIPATAITTRYEGIYRRTVPQRYGPSDPDRREARRFQEMGLGTGSPGPLSGLS